LGPGQEGGANSSPARRLSRQTACRRSPGCGNRRKETASARPDAARGDSGGCFGVSSLGSGIRSAGNREWWLGAWLIVLPMAECRTLACGRSSARNIAGSAGWTWRPPWLPPKRSAGSSRSRRRTHGRHAVPITFGLRPAGWIDELDRHVTRLRLAEDRVFTAMTGGAAGTFASLGQAGPRVQDAVAARLGLAPMAVPSRAVAD